MFAFARSSSVHAFCAPATRSRCTRRASSAGVVITCGGGDAKKKNGKGKKERKVVAGNDDDEVVTLTKGDLKRAIRTGVTVALDELLASLELEEEEEEGGDGERKSKEVEVTHVKPLKLPFVSVPPPPPPTTKRDDDSAAAAAPISQSSSFAASAHSADSKKSTQKAVKREAAPVAKIHPLWPTLFNGWAPAPGVGSIDDDALAAEIPPVAYLHACLDAASYNVAFDGEVDEVADFMFGPATAEAVATFQACHGLPDTGVVDGPTWHALLVARFNAEGMEDNETAADKDDIADAVTAALAAPPPWGSRVDGGGAATHTSGPTTSAPLKCTWPALRRDDGGTDVALLQTLMSCHGYYCDEDESTYWTFGPTTEDALRTFQACAQLPDTGITCAVTWKALLSTLPRTEIVSSDEEQDLRVITTAAVKDLLAKPAFGFDFDALLTAHPNDGFEALVGAVVDASKDLARDGEGSSADGAIWLLGEQRWARRPVN